MKLNKFFAVLLMVAAIGMVACNEKNAPSGPGGDPSKDNPEDTTKHVTSIDTTKAVSLDEAIKKADVDEVVVVKGYVSFAYTTKKNNNGDLCQDAWIAENANEKNGKIEAYYCTITDSVAKGDYVVVEGKVISYTKKDGSVIYEIKDGRMELLRKAGGQSDVPPTAIDTTKAISLDEAIKKADVDETVVVKGYVSMAYNTKKNSRNELCQDAWIAEKATDKSGKIEAYYCTITDSVAKGDYVVVEGKVISYTKKDGSVIYEIKDGRMELLRKGSGQSDKPSGEVTGEGTLEKPYSVADVLALNNTKEGPAYVKGYIIGQVNGKTMSATTIETAAPYTGNDNNEGTNLVIADVTSNAVAMVAVQLPAGFRAFSLPANPDMLGKEILIYGKLQAYFGQAGVKEMTYAVVDGKEYGIKPAVITGDELLNETLLTQASFDKFEVVNVSGDLTWVFDSKYGAKMSGYDNNTKQTLSNEDWLISPAFDASKGGTITFEHGRGPAGSMSVSTDHYTLWISNDYAGDVKTATWAQLTIPTHGTTAWGYVNSGEIKIPAANQKANCHIAWKYVCDDKESATWEVKNVLVK